MLTILLTALATLIVVLVIANLSSGEKTIEHNIERLYASDDPQFLRSMGLLLGPPVIGGNRFEVLANGDEIFPSMLAAVRSAQKSITFETFIYWSGEIGEQMAQALADKARAGVAVHVLLDWMGSSKMDQRYLKMLRDGGAEVFRYHKPHWTGLGRMNDRTHRKLLVMREFDGWDYERISQVLEVPLGTVKSRLSRARQELHALLAGSIQAEDLS